MEYFLYKTGEWLACSVPWRAAYALGRLFSTLQFYFSKKDREAVLANLRVILPHVSEKALLKKAKEVFINFGLYLVEFFRYQKIDRDYVQKHMKMEGEEFLIRALKEGKGGILLTAHLGNWELGGMALALSGYPLMAIALDHRTEKVNSFFKGRRQSKGMEVVSLGSAGKRCFAGLKKNKFVAILGDREFSNSGNSMKFLGKEKIIPRGPAFLAFKTHAPIIPIFVIREGLGQYKVKLFPPLKSSEFANELELMAAYVKIIEREIYNTPEQWLMFREFWKE